MKTKVDDRDLEIRWTRGKGSGGQNRNKTENCCNLTHLPTMIEVRVDARDRAQSLREAKRRLTKILAERSRHVKQQAQRARRDAKIQPGAVPRVRTYDY